MRSTVGRAIPPDVPRRVFLGRDAELRELVAALPAGHAPTGRFIVVSGEGGIGKTSLIDAAVQHASPQHFVLRASADAMDQRRPYGLLQDAFASLPSDDDHSGGSQQNRYAVGERLLALIDEVAVTPTILVVEDLQWADADSLALLTRLSRTLGQLPLAIVGSMRTQARHETPPALDRLISVLSERDLLLPIALAPLSAATCRSIAERLAGGSVEGPLARYVAAAGGNPLFLTEMIRALLRDGALTLGERGEVLLDAPVGPSPSLAMVMMRHLSHLSAPTRELLTSAALLGTRFPAMHLRVVAGRPMSALVPLLQETFAAGFLEETELDTLGFRHELIQHVLLQDVPAAVRAELHREIAARLDAAEVAPATVAGHLLQAPTTAEDLPWTLRLAQRTAVAAPDTATELWRRVYDATSPGDPSNTQATAGLAVAALSAGHVVQAAELAADALRRDLPPDAVGGLSQTLAHALLLQHRHAEARDAAERYAAAEVLEPRDRAAQLAFAGWPRLMLGDIDGALRSAREGAAMSAATGNHGAEVLALSLHGQIANLRGDLDEATAVLRDAATKADRRPSFNAVQGFPHALLALALSDADQHDEIDGLLQRCLRMSIDVGYRTGMVAAHSLGSQALMPTAILPDVAAEMEAHRALVTSMDVRLDAPIHGLRAVVMAYRHGAAAAFDLSVGLDPVPEWAVWGGRGRSWIWLGRSLRHRAEGDSVATFEALWQGWEEFQPTDMRIDSTQIGLELVVLARKVADQHPSARRRAVERAHEIDDVVWAVADRNPSVAHLRATALAVRGVSRDDAADLVEAERLLAATPRRLQHARVAELAARARTTAHDARTLAEASLRGYTEVGADHEVIRARAAFRRAGVAVRTASRVRPTSGWEALTRTEERVAGHVATGATNPEIAERLGVSRRTIETHVSNVLTKLGLRSRTEVAVFVSRRLEHPRQNG